VKNFGPGTDVFLGIVAAALILNLWYLASVALADGVVPITYGYILQAVSMFFAALIGAGFAFYLAGRDEHRKSEEANIMALRKALLALQGQITILAHFQKSLTEYEHKKNRHIMMPETPCEFFTVPLVNFTDLGFLFRFDGAKFLYSLTIHQEIFQTAFSTIQRRNSFHVNEVLEVMNRHLSPDGEIIVANFVSDLGAGKMSRAESLTDDAYMHIPYALEHLIEKSMELVRLALSLYPEEKFDAYRKLE
jgi:hypothetical protein